MEFFISLIQLKNTGLVNAGVYRLHIDLVVPGASSDQAVLLVWNPGQPRYIVRGRSLGVKNHGIPRESGTEGRSGVFSTPFQVDYEEEDVELNESCLIHVNATILDLQASNPAQLNITLEFKQEAGFRSVGTQILELNGDRYGLRDAGVIFFRDLEFGSAILDLVVLSSAQTLAGGKIEELLFCSETIPLDDERPLDDPAIVRATRKLGAYLSPYKHSLLVLENLAKELKLDFPLSTDSETQKTVESGEYIEKSIRELCREVELIEQVDGPKRVLLWHAIVQSLKTNITSFAADAKIKWMQRARDVAGELFIREKLSKDVLSTPQDPVQRTKEYRTIAEKLRGAPRFSEWDYSSRPLSGSNTFLDEAGRPVVFEQRFHKPGVDVPPPPQGTLTESGDGIHLVVLVHGFLGTRWDMRVFELVLASLNIPGLRCKAIESNENHSEWPLEDQGVNVAGEIVAYAKGKNIKRLSFVAYSMGTVVVRCALNQTIMRQFDGILHTFVSVAGPHLGSTGSDSALVGFGQWALMKWKRIQSLAQLGLEDDTLLKLSENSQVLANFKSIALVSSADDTYVPSFSARMELPAGKSLPVVEQMQRNLVEKVLSKVPKLSKIEMAFEFASKRTARARMDAFLGRAAHVHILDSIPLTLSMLLIFGDEWFR